MGGDSCLSGHEFESINFRSTLIWPCMLENKVIVPFNFKNVVFP